MLTEIPVISGEFARRYTHSTFKFALVFVQSSVEFFQTLPNDLYELHVQVKKFYLLVTRTRFGRKSTNEGEQDIGRNIFHL